MLGEFQTLVDPRVAITPFVSVLTGITDAMVCGAPTDRGRAAGVPRVRPRQRAGRAQRAVRRRLPQGGLRRARTCRGPGSRSSTPRCWPAGCSPATKCPTASCPRSRRSSAPPPRRRTGRCTTRARRSTCCTGCSSGSAASACTRCPSCARSPRRSPRRSGASGTSPTGCPRCRASTSSATRRAGRCTSARAATCASRVRQYFVASETRSRMGEMVGLAERVDPIPCAHALEAQVRELRLIAAHKPRYNRRSKFPERAVWLKLTVEAFPRLSVVRDVRADGASYLGPLRSQRQAEAVRDAIHDAVPLRQCSDRLSLRRVVRRACVLAGIGRCGAPCEGGVDQERYAALVGLVASAWAGDVAPARRAARAQARLALGRPALRAGRRHPRPDHHRGARLRADAAAGRAARRRRTRGRASRRRRRLGARGRPVRAARRGRAGHPRGAALAGDRGPAGQRRRRRPEPPRARRGERVHPALARAARHPARRRQRPVGDARVRRRRGCAPTSVRPAATRSTRSPTGAGCRSSAGRPGRRPRIWPWPGALRDHRDRDDRRRVGQDPRGGRGHRRAGRRERGVLRRR